MTKRKAAKPRTLKASEHQSQVAVFQWAKLMEKRWPELKLMFAIPNQTPGRSIGGWAYMKAEGLRAGVPDIFLPVAHGGFFGLWIEMKSANNKPTAEQWGWIGALRLQGYQCRVCWSSAEAIAALTDYLESGITSAMSWDKRAAARAADEALGEVGDA